MLIHLGIVTHVVFTAVETLQKLMGVGVGVYPFSHVQSVGWGLTKSSHLPDKPKKKSVETKWRLEPSMSEVTEAAPLGTRPVVDVARVNQTISQRQAACSYCLTEA